MNSTNKKEQPNKKKCQGHCQRTRNVSFFYKVDSPLFPDGTINICRDCVRDSINVDDINEVIGFLRQIDKPFKKKEWDKALSSRDKRHPIGSYLQKLGLKQYDGMTFQDSDGFNGAGKIDLSSAKEPDSIENANGELIIYSDDLVNKWGTGYQKYEYLKMEKFYQDMRMTHDIHTPVHIQKLTELAHLTVMQERLRREGKINEYSKLAGTIDTIEKSAGFRPVDRQGVDDATGMRTLSQIWEEVEKRGWRKPPPIVYNEDIIDGMIISIANYYHRIVGKEILKDVPDDIKEELQEFFEDDLTPVDIDDEEYENIDFSSDDED